jgi:hypothetical protein
MQRRGLRRDNKIDHKRSGWLVAASLFFELMVGRVPRLAEQA